METGIKSSFIPQAPVVAPAQGGKRTGGGFDFLMLIALVLFVASATLAVGVFLYVQFVQRSNTSKQEQLQRAEAAFEPALIEEMGRLDARMRVADQVLASHVMPTVLFELLEQTTLQTIAFSNFELTSSEGNLKLSMNGLAESVNSIALQADLFSKSGVIQNPIFSDISRQINGVRFAVTADIRPGSLDYRTHLTAPSPQIQLAPEPQPLESSPFGIEEAGADVPVVGDPADLPLETDGEAETP